MYLITRTSTTLTQYFNWLINTIIWKDFYICELSPGEKERCKQSNNLQWPHGFFKYFWIIIIIDEDVVFLQHHMIMQQLKEILHNLIYLFLLHYYLSCLSFKVTIYIKKINWCLFLLKLLLKFLMSFIYLIYIYNTHDTHTHTYIVSLHISLLLIS